MPGLDRVIDPVTLDYVDDGAGGYLETPTIRTGVHHQLNGQLNRWPGDPAAGSERYLIRQGNIDRGALAFAEQTTRAALQPFVDAGEARDVEYSVDVEPSVGRLIETIGITDIQGATIPVADIAGVGRE